MSSYVLGNAPSFLVDSKTRIGGDINNFSHILHMPNNNTFNMVAVTYVRIPRTYYLIDSRRGDNYFLLDEDGSLVTVTVADGNYTREAFMLKIVAALNTASPNGYTYAIAYPNSATDTQTLKFTFTVTGNGLIQPIFNFSNTYSECIAKVMGFTVNIAYISYSFSGSSLTSEKPIRLVHTDFVTIKSSLSVNEGNLNEGSSTIVKIPVYSDTTDIEYTMINLEDSARRLVNSQTNVHQFSLYDDDDMLLDLNGNDWHCQVMAFEYNNVSELIINDLRLKYLDNKPKEVLLDQDKQLDGS